MTDVTVPLDVEVTLIADVPEKRIFKYIEHKPRKTGPKKETNITIRV